MSWISSCEVCRSQHEATFCGCERDYFNPCQYKTCYHCYLDRREEYLSCIWCGRWHSPKFATCFKCRSQYDRDEAGRDLRVEIMSRDGFECRYCGETGGQLQIDHIKPCAKGGTADPWNLQVLCGECNRSKKAIWIHRGTHFEARVTLMHYYFTFLWKYLSAEQQKALKRDAESWEYGSRFAQRRRLRQHEYTFCQDCDVDAEPAPLGLRCFACHQLIEPTSEAA